MVCTRMHWCSGGQGRAEIDDAVSSLTAPMSQLSMCVFPIIVSAEGQTRVLTLAMDARTLQTKSSF